MLGWIFKSHKGTAPESSTPGPPHSPGVGVEDPVVAARQKLDIALQHHRVGRLSEAEAAYSEVLAVDPEKIDALHFLGVIAYQRGEHRRAEELISRALSREPSNAPAYNNLGNALGAQGKLEATMGCFGRALALKPDFPEAHFHLGDTLREQDRFSEALGHYQKALSLKPEYAEARWFLAMSQIPAVYEADADPGRHRAAFSRELEALERWFD